MTDPGDLLTDPAAMRAADLASLLPAAATAGAQVRATVGALTGALESLDGFRPRSLLIIADGRAVHDAALAVALLGPRCPIPVLIGAELPTWVGALDVVVVLESGTPGEAAAAAVARRRGAIVLVRGAANGDLAEAVTGDVQVPPIGVPEALAGPGRLAFLLAVASACRLLQPALTEPIADAVADLLDAEALACSPLTDSFVNPAISLADHLLNAVAVVAGLDPAGRALGAHAAAVLSEVGAVPATGVGALQLTQSAGLMRLMGTPRDVFADPFEDSVEPVLLRPLVLRVDRPTDERFAQLASAWLRSLTAALPTAVVIDGQELSLVTGTAAGVVPSDTAASSAGELTGWARQWATAALMMTRLDFAAVYCGLPAGQVAPADAPAGLGPHAGSRHLLTPDTVVTSYRDEEAFDQWN